MKAKEYVLGFHEDRKEMKAIEAYSKLMKQMFNEFREVLIKRGKNGSINAILSTFNEFDKKLLSVDKKLGTYDGDIHSFTTIVRKMDANIDELYWRCLAEKLYSEL